MHDDGSDYSYDSDGRHGARNDSTSRRIVADPEVWADHHSQFLVVGYHLVKDQFEAMGVPVMDRCTFHDFVTFCFKHSSGNVPRW